jgi:thiosulfate/3-mercaptopyruvate sulfurtransferase
VPLTTLINTAALAGRLTDPSLAIVDCRFDLGDVARGEREYRESHVPGAVYAHLDRDLSGEKNGRNGRHPLPDPAALVHTFGRLGIDGSVQVVAYDHENSSFASRLWWLLRWLGHDAVAVLDGGFAKWKAEDRPVLDGIETRGPRTFRGSPREGYLAGVDDVLRAIETGGARLVDARAPERFTGASETVDKVAGHIPGAVSYHFMRNLAGDNTFLPPQAIRDRARASIGDVPAERLICYCGSGVTACQNLLAFEHAGLIGTRLYAGSWSEWSSDPSRPIATGEATSP